MLSHQMFADDLLLFGEASENQMKCVVESLNEFCSTGQSEKLSLWKATHLSFAGRVTLAKSVIEAIPIYPMMSSAVPKACLEDIQRIQRNFLWGDTEHKRRFHAIGWDKIIVPKWMGGLGLRKLDIMNNACLSKLGWKLQTSSTDLWCEVLRGKYSREPVINIQSCKASDSALWKALDALKPTLARLNYWSVGDGRGIDTWSEAWIEEGIILDQIIDIPQSLRSKKLYELVDVDGQWNWSLFEGWIPKALLKNTTVILPPNDEYGSDERMIIGENKHQFSVSNMYKRLCCHDDAEANNSWKRIWKLNVRERERINYYMGDLHQWIATNLHNTFRWNGKGSWCDFWALCCHCIWNWRNKELFEENFLRPPRPVQHVLKLIGDYMSATSKDDIIALRNQEVTMIGWSPPRELFVRLNTDDAYKEHVVAGCGELWRVYEGLSYARRMGFRQIELHIDSISVVRALNNSSSASSHGGTLLKQIWKLLEMDWIVEISHTYREANKCADALANLGCYLAYNTVFYDACPTQIRDIFSLILWETLSLE
ncbi:hypothetical protein TSUD_73970 [Trifolium subterraneum]|uniref:RNase H type-1 domain-containing protein n=1 Tax=Trifolium subterraneum TaxID=3900 RepID=A0A2Z6M2U1_TRISU|nr:hypothetical protein TSUD_73970 [Trifolium subterraneum]